MILKIDTNQGLFVSLSDAVHELGHFNVEKVKDFIPSLKALLENNSKSLKDIESVTLIQGQGTFSNTRAGFLLALNLKEMLSIPIYDEHGGEITKLEPTYNGIPNIG